MSRQSAESRAAAAYRAGSAPPAPPRHLSKQAAAIWVEIAASKPADWFDAGARILLENYCETAVHARGIAKRLAHLRKSSAWEEAKPWEKRLALMSTTLTTLATKLRLSVQALVDRRSRGILERGAQPEAKQPDTLLGGKAVWGDSAKLN